MRSIFDYADLRYWAWYISSQYNISQRPSIHSQDSESLGEKQKTISSGNEKTHPRAVVEIQVFSTLHQWNQNITYRGEGG